MFISDFFKFIITGAFAGVANGLFGAGGGLFIVPLFIHWCKIPERNAFASSVAIILPLSIVSAFIYFKNGYLNISISLPYIIGGALGGFISGRFFKNINMLWLRRIFGIFILYGGFRAILGL